MLILACPPGQGVGLVTGNFRPRGNELVWISKMVALQLEQRVVGVCWVSRTEFTSWGTLLFLSAFAPCVTSL